MVKERAVFQNEKEVVHKFELTNNEWLRYRLVRELPDRGNFYEQQTYWTQTKPLAESKPFLTDDEIFDFRLKSQFEEATMVISGFTNRVLNQDTLPSNEVSELAQRLTDFQETFNPQWQLNELAPDTCLALDKNAREWGDRLVVITDNKARAPEEEVDVITAIFRLEGLKVRQEGEPQLAAEKITDALKQGNYSLLGAAIVGRDYRISSMAYQALWVDYLNYKRRDQSWPHHSKAVIELLDPLLVATKGAISKPDELNNIRTYADLTQAFLDTMQENTRIRLEYLQTKSTDFTQVADGLLDISLENFESSRKHFRHDSLVALLSILTGLYKLGDKPSGIPQTKIYEGLNRMYAELVGKYKFSTYSNPTEHHNFAELAEVMGLDMKQIAS